MGTHRAEARCEPIELFGSEWEIVRFTRPPIEPSQGSTDRTLFGFQRPKETSRNACLEHPKPKDESGWPMSHPLETGRPVYERRPDGSTPRPTGIFGFLRYRAQFDESPRTRRTNRRFPTCIR